MVERGEVTMAENPRMEKSENNMVAINDRSMNFKSILDDRDEMWREHERSQFAFMDREHQRFLRVLHQEIEQLQRKCAGITLELANALTISETAGTDTKEYHSENTEVKSKIADLQRQLNISRTELSSLYRLNDGKDHKIIVLERRYNDQENRLREELEQKNKEIKDIMVESSQKSALIAQMMTQLHQLRLREAIEKQRRQLGELQAKRRQLLLKSMNMLGSDRSDQESQPFNVTPSVQQQIRMDKSRLRLFNAPNAVRSSILPPITQATSSAVNIEKPESIFGSRSFRSSFRGTKFGRQSHE